LYVVIAMTELLDIDHCLDVWSQIVQEGNTKTLPYVAYSQSSKSAESGTFFCVGPHHELGDCKDSVPGLLVF
jgi:hypothetical protein